MTEKQTQQARKAAMAFQIWQIGKAVDWDITASEIADKLRLTPSGVGKICAFRGWPIRKNSRDGFQRGPFNGGTTILSMGINADLAPYRRLAAQAAD